MPTRSLELISINMSEIIDGRQMAEKIKDRVVEEILAINQGDKSCPKRPNLAIILLGNREDSEIYVSKKESEAKKVGIDTHIYRCAENTPETEVFAMIDTLNKDRSIDAILVQLPLPEGYDTDGIIRAIDPKKDVDRFHPDNIEVLLKTCRHEHVMPPIFQVILVILEEIKYNLEGSRICIVANSDLFLRSLAKVMECRGADTCMVHANDSDLKGKTREADVLITAVGKPGFITEDMIKEDVVIIDIGIIKEGKKVVGDVNFEECQDKASFITPVPGGVGPLTIAMLFKNTLELYKERRK